MFPKYRTGFDDQLQRKTPDLEYLAFSNVPSHATAVIVPPAFLTAENTSERSLEGPRDLGLPYGGGTIDGGVSRRQIRGGAGKLRNTLAPRGSCRAYS